jgi:hypothetical protein
MRDDPLSPKTGRLRDRLVLSILIAVAAAAAIACVAFVWLSVRQSAIAPP